MCAALIDVFSKTFGQPTVAHDDDDDDEITCATAARGHEHADDDDDIVSVLYVIFSRFAFFPQRDGIGDDTGVSNRPVRGGGGRTVELV